MILYIIAFVLVALGAIAKEDLQGVVDTHKNKSI